VGNNLVFWKDAVGCKVGKIYCNLWRRYDGLRGSCRTTAIILWAHHNLIRSGGPRQRRKSNGIRLPSPVNTRNPVQLRWSMRAPCRRL